MRTLVILNPRAGNAHQRQALLTALDHWRGLDWEVRLVESAYPGHAIELAREGAEEGYQLVVAAGGDGTVNEVVNGLAYTRAALGVLPIGTGNVWVRELHLPIDPISAAILLAQGSIYTLDLGQANDRYFLLMAGVGFDATVTRQVQPEEKRKMGILAYILKGVSLALNYSGARARVKIDSRAVKGAVLMVLISNSRLYGGYVRIAHAASMNDGLLDVCLLKGRTLWSVPPILAAVLTRRRRLLSTFEYYQAREVEVVCSRPMDVQVDGDAIGRTPMVFRAAPGALRALIPPTVSEQDFLRPPQPVGSRLRRQLRDTARRIRPPLPVGSRLRRRLRNTARRK